MKAAVCDDDEVFALDLKKRLKSYKFIRTVDFYTAPVSAAQLAEEGYDVIFMDIDWKQEFTGIDLARQLYERNCPSFIIFVTSYAEKFIQEAVLEETNMVGFLLKPVSEDMLLRLLNKVMDKSNARKNRVLRIKINGSDQGIPLEDILYLEGGNHFVLVHQKDKVQQVPGTLQAMEKRLPENFARCQKGFIVNMDHIQIRTAVQITMEGGEEITVGRFYSSSFREKYRKYLENKI